MWKIQLQKLQENYKKFHKMRVSLCSLIERFIVNQWIDYFEIKMNFMRNSEILFIECRYFE